MLITDLQAPVSNKYVIGDLFNVMLPVIGLGVAGLTSGSHCLFCCSPTNAFRFFCCSPYVGYLLLTVVVDHVCLFWLFVCVVLFVCLFVWCVCFVCLLV